MYQMDDEKRGAMAQLEYKFGKLDLGQALGTGQTEEFRHFPGYTELLKVFELGSVGRSDFYKA